VARHYKPLMKDITLFIFAGVAEMGGEPESPKVEFLMAIAGPLASTVLMAFGIWQLFSGYFIAAFWYFLIGMFLRGASQTSLEQFVLQSELRGGPGRRFMRPHPVAVHPGYLHSTVCGRLHLPVWIPGLSGSGRRAGVIGPRGHARCQRPLAGVDPRFAYLKAPRAVQCDGALGASAARFQWERNRTRIGARTIAAGLAVWEKGSRGCQLKFTREGGLKNGKLDSELDFTGGLGRRVCLPLKAGRPGRQAGSRAGGRAALGCVLPPGLSCA